MGKYRGITVLSNFKFHNGGNVIDGVGAITEVWYQIAEKNLGKIDKTESSGNSPNKVVGFWTVGREMIKISFHHFSREILHKRHSMQ